MVNGEKMAVDVAARKKTMSFGKGELELIIHKTESRTDSELRALVLLRPKFNGELRVTERQSHDGEIFPTLWVRTAQYKGLSRIEGFLRLLEKARKPVQPL